MIYSNAQCQSRAQSVPLTPRFMTTRSAINLVPNNDFCQRRKSAWSPGESQRRLPRMMIDDNTLKQLLRINDNCCSYAKFLNEKRDMATSSRLIPLVDDLTHISDRSWQEQTALKHW